MKKYDFELLNYKTFAIELSLVHHKPGLVVMGGDTCSEGCGFESEHSILDGHFFTCICCKNSQVCLNRTENGPFIKNKQVCYIKVRQEHGQMASIRIF